MLNLTIKKIKLKVINGKGHYRSGKIYYHENSLYCLW